MTNETKAKYHHLVPRTYMSAWAHGNGTLKVEFLNNPGIICERNKDKIAGITNFHSITAGMPICTQADTDKIFACLQQYCVEHEGSKISDTLQMNKVYFDFDNWVITRADGSLVGKKQIRSEIGKVKIKDIEANWAEKYENKWASEVAKIENCILNCPNDHIAEFDREYLMKFFIALDWRGFSSNAQFEATLKWLCNDIIPMNEVDIPEEERILPGLQTAEEEMRHYLLLSYYRKYLNDSGIIYQQAMACLARTSFHFLVADGTKHFITSDSPSFVHKLEGQELVGLMPITPRILMAQGRNSDQDGYYYISHLGDEKVAEYNAAIRENAVEFIIHSW